MDFTMYLFSSSSAAFTGSWVTSLVLIGRLGFSARLECLTSRSDKPVVDQCPVITLFVYSNGNISYQIFFYRHTFVCVQIGAPEDIRAKAPLVLTEVSAACTLELSLNVSSLSLQFSQCCT